MPTSFIHDGHPGIADSIVSYTNDLSTLVALRATCKVMQAAVEAVLFAHVELHSLPPRAASRNAKQAAPSSLIMRVPRSCMRFDLRSSFPTLPFSPGAVKALDLTTADDPHLDPKAFTSLHTLRTDHQTTDLRGFEAHTVVCTVLADSGAVLSLAPGVRRIVLHVCLPPAQPGSRSAWGRAVPVTLNHRASEVVFVMSQLPPVTYHQVANWLIKTILGLHRHVPRSITIVGLAEDASSWFHNHRHLLLLYTSQHLSFIDTLLARMRFISLAEWHTELGERKALERTMMEPRPVPTVSAVHTPSDSQDVRLARVRKFAKGLFASRRFNRNGRQ